MKHLLLFLCLICGSAYSQTSDEWFKKGEQAYKDENFVEAVDCYKKAANLGSMDACAILSFMYYNSAVNGKRDTEMALLWAKRVGTNKILTADVVLALISYYKGEFSKTIDILKYWKEEYLGSEAKLALAISYLVNGSETSRFTGKQKAELLVKSVYEKLKLDKYSSYYYVACAIIAKIESEKKGGFSNNNVYRYLEEFGHTGKDDYVYCPLAEYVSGLLFYNLTDTDMKKIGKTKLQIAAEHNYDKSYKILYPFAKEIVSYYNKVK